MTLLAAIRLKNVGIGKQKAARVNDTNKEELEEHFSIN